MTDACILTRIKGKKKINKAAITKRTGTRTSHRRGSALDAPRESWRRGAGFSVRATNVRGARDHGAHDERRGGGCDARHMTYDTKRCEMRPTALRGTTSNAMDRGKERGERAMTGDASGQRGETRSGVRRTAWRRGRYLGGTVIADSRSTRRGPHEVAHSVGELLRQRGCFRSQDTGGINDKNFRKLSPSALSSIWRTGATMLPCRCVACH